MKLKKLALATALVVAAIGSANAAIKSDIIMIVDESGSMGDVQTNLRNNIGTFASILQAGGLDVQFGLVGYGSSSVAPRMLTNLTNAAGFAAAAAGLLINGGTEPGYTASAFALNELDNQSSLFNFRANAVKNLIIFTDEPSNGDTPARGTVGGSAVTKAILDQLLTDHQALYNAVLRNSNTIASYEPLPQDHHGQTFDLNGLNTNNQATVQAFVNSFATAKLQETLTFCQLNPTAPQCQQTTVPEPSVLALLGLGLLGLGFLRRKA